MGLHITKGLLDRHGGTIEMFSDGPNLGCTSIIELPLYMYPTTISSSSLLQNDKHTTTDSDTTVQNSEVGKIVHHCLVVDDSLPNRKLLARLLEKAGHTCIVACDGLEANRIIDVDRERSMNDIHHIPIDTILMDYEMPVLNGPNATKMIRDKGCCRIMIIGVTGNVLTEDVSYFIEMGANHVLAKPVNLFAIEQCWEKFFITE